VQRTKQSRAIEKHYVQPGTGGQGADLATVGHSREGGAGVPIPGKTNKQGTMRRGAIWEV